MKPIQTLIAAALAVLSAAAFAAVDVNKASQAELEAVKGIGPSMSSRILDARKTGAFKDWADMQSRVKGVRNGNSAKFSADGLTVNGAAYAGSTVSDTKARAASKPVKAEKNAKEGAKKPVGTAQS